MSSCKRIVVVAAVLAVLACAAAVQAGTVYDVRDFGAKGDGKTIDSPAINKAIETAAAAGGGTVYFPAGTYRSYSIRLKSNICLFLDQGSVLRAAAPSPADGQYDLPEPNESDVYQDFGHSHWQNSLIWGIGLENVSIMGPGLIDGDGLTTRGPGARWAGAPGVGTPASLIGHRDPVAPIRTPQTPRGDPYAAMDGQGNKAIALKLCRNVILRDFSVLRGGHFVLLATGVDNLTIDNVKVDTNRDGFDIDSCRNVRISNCSINSPNDDAIVLKSSFALGRPAATEHVTITNCQVSGYDLGTFLNGTFGRTKLLAPDRDGVTGRIKLGTESNGAFRNITISNCVFDRSRGLALETVDGAILEDIAISNITMRDVTNSPLFLRLGSRMRAPEGTPVGALRRVTISNVVAYDADPQFASIISGIPGHDVEDVRLSHIRIVYRGGGTTEWAALVPPEKETGYPDPSMFGRIPAYGFYVRHAASIVLDDVEVSYKETEARPAFILDGVKGLEFRFVKAQATPGAPMLRMKDAADVRAYGCPWAPDGPLTKGEY